MKKSYTFLFALLISALLGTLVFATGNTMATSQIHYIAVGGSDSILVESNGHYGLIDASNPTDCGGGDCANNNRNIVAVERYLDSLGIKHLDFVVATHNHYDHIGGMSEIARKYVDSNTTYYYRGCAFTNEDSVHANWMNNHYCTQSEAAMQNAGANMYNFLTMPRLDGFDFYGSHIDFYNIYREGTGLDTSSCASEGAGAYDTAMLNSQVWSSTNHVGINLCNENYNSIVTKVTDENGKTSLLLADTEDVIQNELINQVGKIDVLKAAHHGYNNGTNSYFIDAISPSMVIVPQNTAVVASDYGNLLEVLSARGIPYYTTGDAGNGGNANISENQVGVIVTSGPNGEMNVSNPTYYSLSGGNWVIGGDAWRYVVNGTNLTGWHFLPWSGGADWFYFDQTTGNMLSNTTTPDGYLVDSNGVWSGKPSASGTGGEWKNTEKGWQYLVNGVPVTGWGLLKWSGGEDWFYFDNAGIMLTGWQHLPWSKGADWFYFDAINGNMFHDTHTPDGYYVDENGVWDGKTADASSMQIAGAAFENKAMLGDTVYDVVDGVATLSDKTSQTDPNTGKDDKKQSEEEAGTSDEEKAKESGGDSETTGEKREGCIETMFFGEVCAKGDDKGGMLKILNTVVDVLSGLVGIVGVVCIAIFGVMYLTAGGNEEQVTKAKRRILQIVIGLVAYVLLYAFLKWLLPDFG